MTTSIAKIASSMTKEQLTAALGQSVAELRKDLYKYLKFDGRIGRFSTKEGENDITFDLNQKLLINLMDTTHGYVCWKDGKVVDSINESIFTVLPPLESVEIERDHGPFSPDPQKREGWRKQYTINMKLLSTGNQFQLKLSNISGNNAFADFLTKAFDASTAGRDLTSYTPVVSLGAESFKSKDGNKNYKPKFEIVDWAENPKTEEVAVPAANPTAVSSAVAALTAPEEDLPVGKKKATK